MASSKEINTNFIKKLIRSFFGIFGYEIKKKNNFFDRYNDYIVELNDEEKRLIDKFEKISLTTRLNLWSIFQSVRYIEHNKIEGDIVECGIYNGNTLSLLGNLLNKYNSKRMIWGYDTFEEGFIKSTLSKYDKEFNKKDIDLEEDSTKYLTMDEVITNINRNDSFDEKKYTLIKGDIIKSLDNTDNVPEKISFLRMDTDIYSTTKKQLEILYPKLTVGGVLHIDDYGFCPGVKQAVDEYFVNKKVWLHRVDLTCRYLIKSEI